MKQFFGMSQRGNLDEALQGLYRPQFIMLLSNNAIFHHAGLIAHPDAPDAGHPRETLFQQGHMVIKLVVVG